MIRTRRYARMFILLLWAGCVLAIVGVVMQNRSSAGTAAEEASLFSSAAARQPSTHQRDLKRRYPAGAAIYPANEVGETDGAPFFVFANKTAFFEHFKYQYPEAELNEALQKALKNRRNEALSDTIDVIALSPADGLKFEKRYQVKMRFKVGKVPE